MLYIIGTPIGNLKDISERAKETLRMVDVVIMESPVDSKKLLNILGIQGKIIKKFNDINARRVLGDIVEEIQGKNAAYITSAGMPTISDPGALLVQSIRERGMEVVVIPGPSAVTTAFAGSGIRSHEFTFIGFLPRKQGQIEKLFQRYKEQKSVLIFFESPFRIAKTIAILEKIAPDVYICITKELTKVFEKYHIGTPKNVLDQLMKDPKHTRGEYTSIVDFRI